MQLSGDPIHVGDMLVEVAGDYHLWVEIVLLYEPNILLDSVPGLFNVMMKVARDHIHVRVLVADGDGNLVWGGGSAEPLAEAYTSKDEGASAGDALTPESRVLLVVRSIVAAARLAMDEDVGGSGWSSRSWTASTLFMMERTLSLLTLMVPRPMGWNKANVIGNGGDCIGLSIMYLEY